MKVFNLYFSSTGNTRKVARRIAGTAASCGHRVDTVRAVRGADVDFLGYDVIFVGSGVYEWLPGGPLRTLFSLEEASWCGLGAAGKKNGKERRLS